MRKYFALGALALALLALSFIPQADAQRRVATSWKFKDLMIRTATITGDPNDQGYIDSTQVRLGAVTSVDTAAAVLLENAALGADSLQRIVVEVIGASAFASGESVYVAIDGGGGGQTVGEERVDWTALGISTCGVCNAGGFHTSASLVPGVTRGASIMLVGTGSATSGHAASASGALGRGALYGGFGGWPVLRLRFRSDYVTAPVSNLVRYRVWYMSASED